MSAALTLAKPEHLERLMALVEAFHTEHALESDTQARHDAIAPLLEGMPHGAAYLIGPPRAPIGYIVLSFGWSVEFGGLFGAIDELFIRAGVRGRGIASEVLLALPTALSEAGVKALFLDVKTGNDSAHRIYTRAGFKPRDGYQTMFRRL